VRRPLPRGVTPSLAPAIGHRRIPSYPIDEYGDPGRARTCDLPLRRVQILRLSGFAAVHKETARVNALPIAEGGCGALWTDAYWRERPGSGVEARNYNHGGMTHLGRRDRLTVPMGSAQPILPRLPPLSYRDRAEARPS
jgi:hypothetical protein